MTDNSQFEKEAEFYIASLLARHEIIVAKPLCDREGGDLLALLRVEDGARFMRIQCKGRRIAAEGSCHVQIPARYVSGGFALLVYVRPQEGVTEPTVLLFLGADVRHWHKSQRDEYCKTFSLADLAGELAGHVFSNATANRLTAAIKDVDTAAEFKTIVQIVRVPQPDDRKPEIRTERVAHGWLTTLRDPITGTVSTRSSPPGDPADFDYNHLTDTWTARTKRL